MPELVLKRTGKPVFVTPEGLADAMASGLYEAPGGDETVAVEVRPGLVGQTSVRDLDVARAAGATPESEKSFRGREREVRLEREHGGLIDEGITFLENAANEATLGLTGALGELIGGEDYTERRLERGEANPLVAGAGKVTGIVGGAIGSGGTGTVGRIARATPLGAATKLGTRIAKAAPGAGTVTKIGRIAAGGAVEGGLTGAGEAVQQLTDMSDPVTWEKATSVLSSNMLYGAGIGGAANLAGKVVEKGLGRAKQALDDVAERAGLRGGGAADDLARLDSKGLRAARESELEAIEAARVPQRAEVAQDLAAFRKEMKEQKIWLATKGAEDAEVRAIGKRTLKADRQLDNLLDDPKALAEKPQAALSLLRKQEAALDELVTKHGANLRAKFASDTSGARVLALDNAAAALERNRGLQKRIGELASAPSSERLTAIGDAADVLQSGEKKTLPQQLLEGSVFGNVTALASPLGPLAPMVGAKASKVVGELVFGRMAKATSEVTARTSKAIGAFLDVTKKVTPAAPVLATKLLSRVAFAPSPPGKKGRERAVPVKKAGLAEIYKMRTDEVRSQVTLAPDGSYVMRPEARARMSQQLAAIRAVAPMVADKMESTAALRIQFLASKMPRRPEASGMQFGPDRWQPGDMQMREWARYVSATEDPAGVVERLAAGTVTPEDGEAMKAVYPEMYAQIQAEIIEQLPTLQKTLPYSRRIALSIFSGVPVDPAMDPGVLGILQSTYTGEGGTAGGVQAPRAQPQFGSVKKSVPEPTPAQSRAG